jgi:hypothetical protein
MCWLWVCCLVLWRGLYRDSPVVSLAVSVSAAGFVEGGVLLSSYRAVAKGEPGGRWSVGIRRARRFLFLCFWFGVMSSAGVDR